MSRPSSTIGAPLFEVLKFARTDDNGSKILGFIKNGCHPGRNYKYYWMDELAMRYVRRFKVLAANADQLLRRFSDEYGKSKPFEDNFPASDRSIGYLIPNERQSGVTATGISHYWEVNKNVVKAAEYREKKLALLMKKPMQPTGELLEAWILKTELEALLHVRTKNRS